MGEIDPETFFIGPGIVDLAVLNNYLSTADSESSILVHSVHSPYPYLIPVSTFDPILSIFLDSSEKIQF